MVGQNEKVDFTNLSKRNHDGKFWAVQLDTRVIKTLYKDDMMIPSYALALAIADEWEAQLDTIDLRLMHVNNMVAKSFKMFHDETLEAYKKKEILKIIENDNICHVEPEDPFNANNYRINLRKAQFEKTQLIFDSMKSNFDINLKRFELIGE